MLEVQMREIKKMVTLIGAWKVQYKIILYEGQEFGDLPVTTKKSKGKRKYKFGSVIGHCKPYIENMQVGDVAAIPKGDYDLKTLQSTVSSWMHSEWGKGAATTSCDDTANELYVLRVG